MAFEGAHLPCALSREYIEGCPMKSVVSCFGSFAGGPVSRMTHDFCLLAVDGHARCQAKHLDLIHSLVKAPADLSERFKLRQQFERAGLSQVASRGWLCV